MKSEMMVVNRLFIIRPEMNLYIQDNIKLGLQQQKTRTFSKAYIDPFSPET